MWGVLNTLEQQSEQEASQISPFVSHDILPVERVPVF